MRGIAASLVVVYHLHYRAGQSWNARGYLWVDFFFILSGFILAYVYGGDLARGVAADRYRWFLGKRLARIYPLHLATLLVALALGLGAHIHHFRSPTHSIVTNALLVHAWGFEHQLTWNAVSWSISAEWGFYLVFPLLIPVLARAGTAACGLLIVAALGGIALIERHSGDLNVTYDYALVRCLLEASIGIALHNLYRDPSAAALRRVLRANVVRWPLLVVPLVLMQYSYDTVVVASFVPLLLAIAVADGSFESALSVRPLKHVGEASYSLYMSHWILIYFVLKVLGRFHMDPKAQLLSLPRVIVANAAVVVICIGVATVLYRVVEVPGRRLVTRLLAGRN
jgi:peptidoglycan/LPS O-acetylase OafA/YrhL